MGQKRFVVTLKDGSTETIQAEAGDEDDEADGYVFFVDADGSIVGLLSKGLVFSWVEYGTSMVPGDA